MDTLHKGDNDDDDGDDDKSRLWSKTRPKYMG